MLGGTRALAISSLILPREKLSFTRRFCSALGSQLWVRPSASIADGPPGAQTINSTPRTGSEDPLSISNVLTAVSRGRQRRGCQDKKPWPDTFGDSQANREECPVCVTVTGGQP